MIALRQEQGQQRTVERRLEALAAKRATRVQNQMQQSTATKQLVTLQRLAQVLGVHPDTVYRALRSGALPAVRVGRQWRFDLDAVLSRVSVTVGNDNSAACSKHQDAT